MFQSWGNSSNALARNNRPTRVTRGSAAILNNPSFASLRSRNPSFNASASGTIVRNFNIRKRCPWRPTRCWPKNTGPRLSSLIATAITANNGETANNPTDAPNKSNARLNNAEERVNSKRLTPITVTPCRSSNSTEEPTTSNNRGNTLTRTPTAFNVRTRFNISPPSTLRGAMIARCTSNVRLKSLISADRDSEKLSVDHAETLSKSRCATTSAFTPPCPVNFERIVSADTSSPMNKHRSAGAIRNAKAREPARANNNPPANANHKNNASCRSNGRCVINPPASHATKAHNVAN